MDRQAQLFLAPPDRLRVERFTDTGDKAQPGEAVPGQQFRTDLHQHADRSGRGVPDRHALLLKDVVPARGIELGLVDHHRDAVQQGREDAVRHACDPSGVGCAPKHIALVQVECVAAGHPVRQRGFVHMHRAFGPTGGAAGEVQQRQVVGARQHGLELGGRRAHQWPQRLGCLGPSAVGISTALPGLLDQKHPLQRWHLRTDGCHFAPVQRWGGEHRPTSPQLNTGGHRLRTKSRVQRRDHQARLERANHRHIELGQPGREDEQAVTALQSRIDQHIGKAVAAIAKVAVAQAQAAAIGAQPADRHPFAIRAVGMPVDRLVTQVQRAAGQSMHRLARLVPTEIAASSVPVQQMGLHRHALQALADAVITTVEAGQSFGLHGLAILMVALMSRIYNVT